MMADYSKALGDCVYRRRKQLGWTQAQLAEKIGVTEQTVRKIEHYHANPQMEILFELVRCLQIDPYEIFFPEASIEAPAKRLLNILLADVGNKEVEELLPIVHASLKILKAGNVDNEQ